MHHIHGTLSSNPPLQSASLVGGCKQALCCRARPGQKLCYRPVFDVETLLHPPPDPFNLNPLAQNKVMSCCRLCTYTASKNKVAPRPDKERKAQSLQGVPTRSLCTVIQGCVGYAGLCRLLLTVRSVSKQVCVEGKDCHRTHLAYAGKFKNYDYYVTMYVAYVA